MKKATLCILLVLTVLFLFGCNSESKYQVGICPAEESTLDYESWIKELESRGCEVTLLPAPTEQAKQIQQVEELSAQRYDLLIIEPMILSVADDIMRPAVDAGIAVLFVNFNEPAPEVTGKVSFIGYNAEAPGLLQAKLLETLPNGGDLNDDGTVSYTILTGPIDHEDVQQQISGIQLSLGADNLLSTKYSDWSAEKGYGMCADMLSSYGRDIEVIFCGSAELTTSALQATTDAGRLAGEDIYLIGMGDSQELSGKLRDGSVSGSIQKDETDYGDQVTEVALSLLTGKPYKTQYYVSYKTVSPE